MKYIIEIAKEYEEYFKGILICGIAEGKFAVDVIAKEDLEELNSDYINEHYNSLQDEAYQRGLDDAWEAARKLFSSMADSDIEKAFPIEWNNGGFKALMNLQPQEAIEKLKAYEEKQKADDEIKVGDEVETKDGKRFVVTTFGSSLDGDIAVGVCADGLGLGVDLKELCKTGRHFDIASILKEMQS